MTEIQQIVDELRFLLSRDVMERTEELTGLVTAYSEFCHEVNVRLRRCDACLKQGLRSEALHLAEAAPNLVDAVSVLDFPEREYLLEVVAMYSYAPPEPLMLDVASALNEAYALQEPLEKLLDMHRLLALGRSPLSQRLPVLRSLARLDPASPHWEADVRDMERARLAEIEAQARIAMSQGDTATLKALVGEVQPDTWLEKAPTTLLRNLKGRVNQSMRGNARQRIEQLNTELYSAFSALDAVTARTLRDEWNQCQQVAQLAQDDPLREHVAPVLNWLADEDRKLEAEQAFVRAAADIERALDDDNLTSLELKRLGATVDRCERSLPKSLDSRYRSRLETLELTESRRRKLLIGAGAAAFATLIAVFGLVIYASHVAETTRRLATAAEVLINEGKLEDARALVDRHLTASASESWLAVQKRLSDAEQAERDRAAEWRAEMEIVSQSTEAPRVEAALKRARELSRTTDEKIELGKLESTWQQRTSELIASRERQFRELLADATQSLRKLDNALSDSESTDSERLQELLAEADSRMEKLRSSQGSVARELGSQSALLESRLQATRRAMADLERKSSLLEKLTEAALMTPKPGQIANTEGRFEATLREFAAALPSDPRASIFKAAADTCPIAAVESRHKLVSRWRRLIPTNEKDIELRMREIRTLLTEHPQCPDRRHLETYETWLASVQRRFIDEGDPNEGLVRRLATLFNGPFIREGHTLRDTKGTVYYIEKARVEPFGSVATFDYLVGFNGETQKSKGLRSTDMAGYKSEPPPQQEIANKVRATIREIDFRNWQQHFRTITETVLSADQVDPFLRYVLVLKTLEFASLGDRLLEDELASVLEALRDDDIDRSVAWMDPFNPSAEKARARAVELLKSVPPLEPIFTRAAMRQDEFERDLFAHRFAVGWLEKTSRGEWICRTKWSPADEHVLYVVSRADADGMRDWKVLGQAQSNTLTVDSAVAQSAGEAAVIFAARAADKSGSKTAQSQ